MTTTVVRATGVVPRRPWTTTAPTSSLWSSFGSSGSSIREKVSRRPNGKPAFPPSCRTFVSLLRTLETQQHPQHKQHQQRPCQQHFSSVPDPGLKFTAVVSHPAPVEGPRGLPSRAQQLEALQQSTDVVYDLLVIGGGATGAGIALDAASRGLKVACVERGDFSSETSSRSTKLIWAGLKYLGTAVANVLSPVAVYQKGLVASAREFADELRLVYHCHVERRYMTTVNRHLCRWIPICVPFRTWILDPPPMQFGLFAIFPTVAPVVFKVYDAMSGFSCPPSYIMTNSAAAKVFPQLDTSDLKYSAVFYEAQHNDARTNLAIAMTAAEKGAHICNYVQAVELLRDDPHQPNKVTGIVALDRMSGNTFEIRAKTIVFAGGPFTDALREMEAPPTSKTTAPVKPAVRGAHGTHVVLPGHLMPQDPNHLMGLLDCNTSDGRFLFVLPWLHHTLMGTTDAKGPAETLPTAPEKDVQWILQESSTYFKDKDAFCPSQVTSAWRGWRPLAVDPHAAPGAPVSRDHVISQHPETKCIFIAGGKWTTWREMSQDVVDKLTQTPCSTLDIGLWGAEGYSTALIDQVLDKYGAQLDRDICQHLVDTYGGHVWEVGRLLESSNPQRLVEGFPCLQAEVLYACREYACTIEDVLSRRTRLAYLNRRAALEAIPTVAQIMQRELKWSPEVTKAQIQAAQAYIECYGGPSKEPAYKPCTKA